MEPRNRHALPNRTLSEVGPIAYIFRKRAFMVVGGIRCCWWCGYVVVYVCT